MAIPIIPVTWEAKVIRSQVQDQPGQHTGTPIKNKQDWRFGSSGRVPALKHKPLSSNHGPTKKIIKNKHQQQKTKEIFTTTLPNFPGDDWTPFMNSVH
jgi:hypothetical protein